MIGLYFSKKTTMNIDWNLLIASFSAIAASAASIATFLGWKENRELRKAQTDPFVDVKLETVDHHLSLLRLKIMNIGKGGAFNLNINLEPHESLERNQKKLVGRVIQLFNDREFMKSGVNYLAPFDYKNTSYLNLYGIDKEIVTSEEFFQLKFITIVSYQDLNGQKFERCYVIDASEFEEYRVGEVFEESVPKSLNLMQDSLKKINVNLTNQSKLLDKKSKGQEADWNEYQLKQKLSRITFIRERNKLLGLDEGKCKFKKIDRKQSIHELRKQNK